MKRLILIVLALAALAAFLLGIVLNNLVVLVSSILLALAAFLADRKFNKYFDIRELRK